MMLSLDKNHKSSTHSNGKLKSENVGENSVEFAFKTPLGDKDLDAIIVFLENVKASGGGEIADYRFDLKKNVVTASFVKLKCKARVLEKRILNFMGYEFTASEPLNPREYAEDKSSIILSNFLPNESTDIVQMFAENLVDEENEVESTVLSQVFPSTYYIRFKESLEIDKVNNRLKKRPSLHGCQISCIPVTETNFCVLIIPNIENDKKLSSEIIELHFENKKRCGASGFVQIHNKESYMILRFDSKENASKCASVGHVISNQKVVVEYLYSYDLLNKFKNSKDHTSEISQSFDKKSSILKKVVAEEGKQSNLRKYEEEQSPVYKIDLSKENNHVFKNKFILGEFTKQLLKQELIVCKREKDIIPIKLTVSENLKNSNDKDATVETWKEKLKNIIESFSAKFKIEIIQATNDPIQFTKAINFDKSKMNLVALKEKYYEISGYEESVDNFISEINRDRQKTSNFEFNNLELYECRILFLEQYLAKIKKCFPNLTVTISTKARSLKISGDREEMNSARKEAENILASITMKVIKIDKIVKRMFLEKEKRISVWIKENMIGCVPMLKDVEDDLKVYSTDEAKIKNFENLLEKDLCLCVCVCLFLFDAVEDDFKTVIDEMRNDLNLVYMIEADTCYLYGFNITVTMYYRKLLAIIIKQYPDANYFQE